MLGSFFDLRREVEAIAARRARDYASPRADPAPKVYEDFDHKMSAFLRSVTSGSGNESTTAINVPGTSFDDG